MCLDLLKLIKQTTELTILIHTVHLYKCKSLVCIFYVMYTVVHITLPPPLLCVRDIDYFLAEYTLHTVYYDSSMAPIYGSVMCAADCVFLLCYYYLLADTPDYFCTLISSCLSVCLHRHCRFFHTSLYVETGHRFVH